MREFGPKNNFDACLSRFPSRRKTSSPFSSRTPGRTAEAIVPEPLRFTAPLPKNGLYLMKDSYTCVS